MTHWRSSLRVYRQEQVHAAQHEVLVCQSGARACPEAAGARRGLSPASSTSRRANRRKCRLDQPRNGVVPMRSVKLGQSCSTSCRGRRWGAVSRPHSCLPSTAGPLPGTQAIVAELTPELLGGATSLTLVRRWSPAAWCSAAPTSARESLPGATSQALPGDSKTVSKTANVTAQRGTSRWLIAVFDALGLRSLMGPLQVCNITTAQRLAC